ncbi:MAG: ParB N-terminal domain-containing protein [Thermodesulfobacteriota bacterium]|nr:ParB N-terminal domain-containing protein [Thermodesulfobacteriota bacterium]
MNFREDFVDRFTINLASIDLASIDLEDYTFRITTETRIEDLILSIKNLGLLNAPILRKKISGFQIISGFRRISACLSLGMAKIPARIVDSDKKKLECVNFAITENSLQRTLNMIEQSRSFYMLSDFYKDNDHLAKAASALGLPANQSIINKIKKICKLPRNIQNGVLSNTISLSMALELEMLEKDEGAALAILFEKLKLSLNKQREIITHIKEIAIIENISIINLLTKSCLREIADDKDLDRSQKINKIRLYLKQRRFPEITKADKELEIKIKNLKLGSNMKLIPPKNYDGSTYSLNLQFASLEQLIENKITLEKIIQNPILKDILV